MFKKVSVFMIINLFFLLIFCTLTTALEEGNSYTTITGIAKDVDHENDMITIVMETKNDDIREFNIKISKGTKLIFVRNVNGLLSVESIKELISGDEVSIKCKGHKGEYETVEIEKIDKVKKNKFTEERR
jgi:hypothetical protein